MGDPYARLRAHVARGLEQKGEIKDEVEEPAVKVYTQPRRPRSVDDDWLQFGRAVVSTLRLRTDIRQEAVQEAALAAWLAAEKWSPDGGMSRRNWIWQQTQRGVIDFLRLRLGRLGNRGEWEESVKHLDEPIAENLTLGDMLAAPDDPLEVVELVIDLDVLIARAGLNQREQQWVDVIRSDQPQKVLMDTWRVSEGMVSIVKRGAVKKLRAAA